MNRKEAIQRLGDIFDYYWIEIEDKGMDDEITEIMEVLESPLTLADLLGWEEGVEYKVSGVKLKIEDGKLLYFSSSYEKWKLLDLNLTDENIKNLQQATKVEPKLKAYHVKDEYSYNCLMNELEEQGYIWLSNTESTDASYWDTYENNTVIYCKENKRLTYSNLDHFNAFKKNSYNLIEYHKEPKPKAWRVRDEYSLECLVQELQDQGFKYKSLTLEEHMEIKKESLSRNGVTYIYVDEDTGIDGFEKRYSLIDEFEIIEYHKEEPRFYAKIKGWENLGTGIVYFYKASNEKIYLATKFYARNTGVYTKTEWNELGINDSNADWEEVAE